jgi:hypothetical protein
MSGTEGTSWDGYADPRKTGPAKPVDKPLQKLWPAGTDFGAAPKRAPGAQMQKKTTLVHPAPSKTGKRPPPRRVK